ncbi:hypothetical protein KXQ82_01680 [Mucilaginibacter sp. HMF5004]|uniref:hypothetical protein n=1 Tax=Mucilaginibacter rivuli TaxID=2857527 RepID=UPI001C5CE311|nr:hypothetical protein [Mucilaginibacter rivuli]MBW4888401.1 hypothetical protein [Mucilaginibacter rivuli]
MSLFRFILYYLGFVIVIAIPPMVLTETAYAYLLVPHFWVLFWYMAILTLIVIVLVLMVQKSNSEFYAQAFLGGTTFKILACLIFMVIFLRKNQVDKLFFMGDFFYIYFLNTVFEVYGLLRNLRNQNLR